MQAHNGKEGACLKPACTHGGQIAAACRLARPKKLTDNEVLKHGIRWVSTAIASPIIRPQSVATQAHTLSNAYLDRQLVKRALDVTTPDSRAVSLSPAHVDRGKRKNSLGPYPVGGEAFSHGAHMLLNPRLADFIVGSASELKLPKLYEVDLSGSDPSSHTVRMP